MLTLWFLLGVQGGMALEEGAEGEEELDEVGWGIALKGCYVMQF
jgi:hypothetical protein